METSNGLVGTCLPGVWGGFFIGVVGLSLISEECPGVWFSLDYYCILSCS